MPSSRSLFAVLALLGAIVAAFLLWPRPKEGARDPAAPPRPPNSITRNSAPSLASAPPAAPAPPFHAADFPLAARLNAPDSTITRDLDLLQQIFDAWRSNFPHEGNPVGENQDITAALAGANRLSFALLPKSHPAINARGELCDRWGTPFRFHQLSGERMEVRSAGPDRKFATEDDAVWTPN